MGDLTADTILIADSDHSARSGTAAEVTALLDIFAETLKGLVPATAAGGGDAAKFLRGDGVWATPTTGIVFADLTVDNHTFTDADTGKTFVNTNTGGPTTIDATGITLDGFSATLVNTTGNLIVFATTPTIYPMGQNSLTVLYGEATRVDYIGGIWIASKPVPRSENPAGSFLRDDGTWATIPTPSSGSPTGTQFLRDDGQWAEVPFSDDTSWYSAITATNNPWILTGKTNAIGEGGYLTIKGGPGTTYGGTIDILGGIPTQGGGGGGALRISGGSALSQSTGYGGSIYLSGGASGSNAGNCGNVYIDAGTKSGSADRGQVLIGQNEAQMVRISAAGGTVVAFQADEAETLLASITPILRIVAGGKTAFAAGTTENSWYDEDDNRGVKLSTVGNVFGNTGKSTRLMGNALGFYSTDPIALQTGVPVTAAGIHAACVALGLFTA